MYGAVAVIGNLTTPSIMVLGDSRDFGVGDIPSTNLPLYGIDKVIAPYYGAANFSIAGDTYSTYTTSGKRLWFTNFADIIWTDLGINSDDSTLMASANAFIARFGKPVIVETLSPYTTSTDGWMTTNNQILYLGAQETNRINYNWAARNHQLTNELACVDVAALTDNNGYWVWGLSTNLTLGFTNLTQDGLHGPYMPMLAASLGDPLHPKLSLPQGGGWALGTQQGNFVGPLIVPPGKAIVLSTNYVAANMTPVPGGISLVGSNNTVYFVTVTSTNHIP